MACPARNWLLVCCRRLLLLPPLLLLLLLLLPLLLPAHFGADSVKAGRAHPPLLGHGVRVPLLARVGAAAFQAPPLFQLMPCLWRLLLRGFGALLSLSRCCWLLLLLLLLGLPAAWLAALQSRRCRSWRLLLRGCGTLLSLGRFFWLLLLLLLGLAAASPEVLNGRRRCSCKSCHLDESPAAPAGAGRTTPAAPPAAPARAGRTTPAAPPATPAGAGGTSPAAPAAALAALRSLCSLAHVWHGWAVGSRPARRSRRRRTAHRPKACRCRCKMPQQTCSERQEREGVRLRCRAGNGCGVPR